MSFLADTISSDTGLTKLVLLPENTAMHIMVSISCSVGAIQILHVLLNYLGFLLATW